MDNACSKATHLCNGREQRTKGGCRGKRIHSGAAIRFLGAMEGCLRCSLALMVMAVPAAAAAAAAAAAMRSSGGWRCWSCSCGGTRMLAAHHFSGWWLTPEIPEEGAEEGAEEGGGCKSYNPSTRAYAYL
eukprot:TRINITY_DN10437_c0_g2_i1.p1 TRINITY_DN10437_c0_g2~~TRINITY_DN10437_c0_g2_i1.p1  ORF type:complete len:130 (-),score=26.85 TRINITY_DN10437_c0_g2_i1:240-629(-)